jgi:hypothetical protein
LPKKYSRRIYFFLVVLLGIASANAAPLDVKKTEVVELLAVQQADYSFSYSGFNVTGFINITNSGSDDLSDIWLAIDLQKNLSGISVTFENASSQVFVTTDATAASDATNGNLLTSGADYFVHIPLLRTGEVVSLYYDVDDSAVGYPILVDESYSVSKIPANAQQTWRVYLNLTLNQAALPAGVSSVKVNITKYLSKQDANFGSSNWTTLGSIANVAVTGGGTPTSTVWDGPYADLDDALNVTDITLSTASAHVNISFDVTGENSNAQRDATLEPFGFATIFFSFAEGMSGSSVVDVFASGPARVAAIKEGPVINSSGTFWNESVEINNTAVGVAYVVRNLSVWAVNTSAGFPDMTAEIPGSYHSVVPGDNAPFTLLPGSGWQSRKYTFENSIVPVVWANMTLKLVKDQTQGWWVVNSTTHKYNTSYGSSYIVVEKILVIGTYLVKATKHILPNGTAADYDVYIVVENIGSKVTPTYVWVYDMVPQNFSVVNKMNVTRAGMLAENNSLNANFWWTSNASNPLSGYSYGYAWKLNALYPGADGDGAYTDAAEIAGNQSVVIFYQVNGTGDFRISDAFIVGIDPTFSMNTQTSPKITIVSGSAARNYENLFAIASIAVLLGAVAQWRKR